MGGNGPCLWYGSKGTGKGKGKGKGKWVPIGDQGPKGKGGMVQWVPTQWVESDYDKGKGKGKYDGYGKGKY